MKLFKYLKQLLYTQKQESADKKLMNAPPWGGFYDRSSEPKALLSKKK